MMKESQKEPLAMGLVGHGSGVVYAQLEIYRTDFDALDFVLRRNPYSGNLQDIQFSIKDRDLEDIIAVLKEAKRKLDHYWLSKLAATELKTKR